MQLCGICLNKSTQLHCETCHVDVCETCSRIIKTTGPHTHDAILCEVCEMQFKMYTASISDHSDCYNRIQSNPKYALCIECLIKHTVVYFTYHFNFCYNCDTVCSPYDYYYYKKMCDICVECPKQRKTRNELSHCKAKPLIEEIYHIKGIAQIIFDYYYKPRRYFPDEM